MNYGAACNVEGDIEGDEISPNDLVPYLEMETENQHTLVPYPYPELKYHDTDQLGNSPPVAASAPFSVANATPQTYLLNRFTAGGSSGALIGNQITCKSLSYHLGISTVSTTQAYVRVCFIWDKQPNGANLPAEPFIFSTAIAFSFQNVNTRNRFIVLRSLELPLGS